MPADCSPSCALLDGVVSDLLVVGAEAAWSLVRSGSGDITAPPPTFIALDSSGGMCTRRHFGVRISLYFSRSTRRVQLIIPYGIILSIS